MPGVRPLPPSAVFFSLFIFFSRLLLAAGPGVRLLVVRLLRDSSNQFPLVMTSGSWEYRALEPLDAGPERSERGFGKRRLSVVGMPMIRSQVAVGNSDSGTRHFFRLVYFRSVTTTNYRFHSSARSAPASFEVLKAERGTLPPRKQKILRAQYAYFFCSQKFIFGNQH